PGRTAHLATTGGRDKVKTRPRQNPTAPRICASRELPIQAKVPVQSASVIGTTRRGGLASSDIVRQANGLLALSSCWRTPPDWPRADTYISKDRCLFVPFTFFPFNHLQMARSTTPFLRIPSIFMGMCGRFFLLYPLPPLTHQGYRIWLHTFLIIALLGLDLIFQETFFPTLSYLSPSAGPPPAGRQRFMSNLSRKMSSRKDMMSNCSRSLLAKSALAATALLLLTPFGVVAQSSSGSSKSSSTSSSSDRWLHVRVISSDAKGETVRVNVTLELAARVLPTINKH